ncbi:protein CutA homolog isoform X2 [Meles meles]|uniref:protein CutA homolog isoform X2 n=1 Tax=Meles meles TaxID=9662 RepID=UPI001E6A0C71|nr:protein CutA homolog isoform X2 [Meles meles]
MLNLGTSSQEIISGSKHTAILNSFPAFPRLLKVQFTYDTESTNILTTAFLSYPMLRTLSLRLRSAVAGGYVSGTYSIVFVNCPNEQIARDIARASLDKKLAASVNILPKASSLYFWNGEIEEATEILLLIKTKTSKVHMLSSYIRWETGSGAVGHGAGQVAVAGRRAAPVRLSSWV